MKGEADWNLCPQVPGLRSCTAILSSLTHSAHTQKPQPTIQKDTIWLKRQDILIGNADTLSHTHAPTLEKLFASSYQCVTLQERV